MSARLLPEDGQGSSRHGRASRPTAARQAPRPATACLALLLLALGGCATLPSLEGRSESVALADVSGTAIHDALVGLLAARPGLSGIYPLQDGEDAFAARLTMIDAAERSLDIQYYIWHADTTGQLMLDALRRAADRGVRVRLLLDDNNTPGLDPTLAALDAHPDVEVRLFNPFMQRALRPLGFLVDFTRLNRRMHNKSLTADGVATIVGGRNIGDEYFAAGDGLGFVDLDVVAVGPVVAEIARSFDQYWRSDSSYPVDRLLPPASAADRAALASRWAGIRGRPEAQRYLAKVKDTRVMRDLVARELPFEWAAARLVVDDPAKGLGKAAPADLLLAGLEAAFGGAAKREIVIVSPYFVPGRNGTKTFAQLAGSGLRVKVLTNALESTDVAAVHSGYAKRRRALLRAGIELFELRRTSPATPALVGAVASGSAGALGSSDASLHAKTFAVDRERIFIGSFNFDPRSARHNTELGIVIDSPTMATQLSQAFETSIPLRAYRLQFDDRGRLEWLEARPDGSVIRYQDEPNAGPGRKLAVFLFGLLPIEGLL